MIYTATIGGGAARPSMLMPKLDNLSWRQSTTLMGCYFRTSIKRTTMILALYLPFTRTIIIQFYIRELSHIIPSKWWTIRWYTALLFKTNMEKSHWQTTYLTRNNNRKRKKENNQKTSRERKQNSKLKKYQDRYAQSKAKHLSSYIPNFLLKEIPYCQTSGNRI